MSDPITRLNAALEGRYRIERELGEGGMATVYLADDLRHERKVALKVLKPELAAVVGAERFLAEIKTTANLQHPHILPLFDSGEADSYLFYVMPYVEGETLRDRIERDKQLPVDAAVRIATDIAGALDYAHRQGVIHRDIKPANVLLQDGRPVVSDFGIALAVGAAGGGRMTETGLSLGTPHYMSPEQATGDQAVGVATDIYALGAVLYEMLIGDPPYLGSTAQAILGKIIAGELASPAKQRSSVPRHVDAAVRRALEKLPADRFAGANDLAQALADPAFRHGMSAEAPAGGRRLVWQGAALLVVGGLLGTLATSALTGRGSGPAPTDLVRFAIVPPDDAPIDLGGLGSDLALSRDGTHIVYQSGTGASDLRFQLRPLNQLIGAPVRGTEGAAGPFFSPDGAWIGFVSSTGGRLQKVSVVGGAPIALAQVQNLFGASWGDDDRIILGQAGSGLQRISGGGGALEEVTELDEERGEDGHLWPSIIPGTDRAVFVVNTGGPPLSGGELAVVDLGTGDITRLGITGVSPRYVATGHLVYAAEDGSIRAVPFDVSSLQVAGSPVPLVEGVAVKGGGAAAFDISADGRLVYVQRDLGSAEGGLQLVWVDRQGGEEVLPMPVANYAYPRLSADGRRIATSVDREAGRDLWVYDAATGAGLRLTRDDEVNHVPMWAPDAGRIFFSSTRDAPRPTEATGAWWGNVYVVPSDGSGLPRRVTTTAESQGLTGITPDGRTATYSRVQQTFWEIMALPLDGSEEPQPVVTGPFRQGGGTISPDGRWLSYRSDETGAFEIYVQPFPGPGAKVPVSIGGGSQPVWSRDSGEIFYLGAGGMMMAATVVAEPMLGVGQRVPLFSALQYSSGGANFRMYDVAPDGRFLMLRSPVAAPGNSSAPAQITVVLNWFEELRERVPN